MAKQFVPYIILLLLPVLAQAQLDTEADWKRQVYDREFNAGLQFATRGYGITARYLRYKDGFKKFGYDFDLVMIRHPKEVKISSAYLLKNPRGFAYDKINSFFTLRTGYGREKILIDKTDQGSISLSWTTFAGASIGILKPVYLEILDTNGQGIQVFTTERYDPDVHSWVDIYGGAPFFTGLEESSLRLGVYAKTGISFDYNWRDNKISTLEIGALIDYFPNWFGLYATEKVPVMANATNYNFWLQFYLTFTFGKKWN